MLFMPLAGEHSVGSTTSRAMAWFSAAVTAGVPLVFVNIQTEQVVTSEKTNSAGRETSWGRQQSFNTTIQIVQGIRLWFLPGVSELLIVLTPEPRETRFGMDIRRTEEVIPPVQLCFLRVQGFICVHTVGKGSAADRAGLKKLQDQAAETGHVVVISRLEGKSLMPSMVPSTGFIHCCDNVEVKSTLVSAIDKMECINVHIMTWPNHKVPPHAPQDIGAATLKPPTSPCIAEESFRYSNANSWYNHEIELS